MNSQRLVHLAEQLMKGALPLSDFVRQLSPTADLDEVQLDLDRQRRCGFPEVVFADGKSVETLEKTFRALTESGVEVFSTRVSTQQAEALLRTFPAARYNAIGRTLRIALSGGTPERRGHVAVITAGTTDLPIAEEARETLDWMGVHTTMVLDVGVAGPHRLPERLREFADADAVVVIAGMEGALPSVVGGYLPCPVIAVPTSVGYGSSFGGIAALLTMLNSCAANVTVVNIDAGFKGAYVAGLIARAAHRCP